MIDVNLLVTAIDGALLIGPLVEPRVEGLTIGNRRNWSAGRL